MATLTQSAVPVNAARAAKAGDARALLAIPEARTDLPRIIEGRKADRGKWFSYPRTPGWGDATDWQLATDFAGRKALKGAKEIIALRLARRAARAIAEAARYAESGRILRIAAARKVAIRGFSGRRLRARRVNEHDSLLSAVRRAVRDGGVGYHATDGGHVANAYGYRAETEWVESHAVVVRSAIRAIRRVGRSDAGKNAASINSARGFGASYSAAHVVERGARIGVVSPSRRTFTFLGQPQWASGRFGWGTAERPQPTEMAPARAERILRRAVERLGLPYAVTTEAGRPVITETATGEQWHVAGLLPRAIRAAIGEAREGFAKRAVERRLKARNEALDAYLAAHAGRIYVTAEDSLAVGNCSSQTDVFRSRLVDHVGASGEIGAVSAAVILSLRDDDYTRRACRAATLRYV
jgi:hypothetical protein